MLPWKRDDEDTETGGMQQNEFPAWASNKEYLAYNSPSATFLGKQSIDTYSNKHIQYIKYIFMNIRTQILLRKSSTKITNFLIPLIQSLLNFK